MPLNICKECGSSSLDIDTAKGQVVCTVCGEVNEATIVVSDPTYEDNGHGGTSMIGTFVSANSTGAGGLGEGSKLSISSLLVLTKKILQRFQRLSPWHKP
jgi:transcription initiation factor TFIIIB Brf1 subunit/transcription initiation factor TFIIB